MPKKNKCVLLLSTMHHDSCIDEEHQRRNPNILDVAAHNADILFLMQHPTYHQGVTHQRRLFINDLSLEIILPHITKLATNQFLQKYIRQDMEKFIGKSESTSSN
ncbi:hypothetical protein PR048_005837, partial [Dryococelus australis]